MSSTQRYSIKVSDGVVILGKRGSGKTATIKYLMKIILKSYKFVVLDIMGLYEDLADERIKVYRVDPTDNATIKKILDKMMKERNQMLVIDEADRFDTRQFTPLNNFINIGRNYNTGFIASARRTADISKDILANATWAFIFKHILPQDLKVLTSWFGEPDETFRNLQEHEVIVFKEGEKIWQGVLPIPKELLTSTPQAPEEPEDEEKEPEKEEQVTDDEEIREIMETEEELRRKMKEEIENTIDNIVNNASKLIYQKIISILPEYSASFFARELENYLNNFKLILKNIDWGILDLKQLAEHVSVQVDNLKTSAMETIENIRNSDLSPTYREFGEEMITELHNALVSSFVETVYPTIGDYRRQIGDLRFKIEMREEEEKIDETPNEYRVRIKNPKQFHSFRYGKNKLGKGVSVVFGIKGKGKDRKSRIQSLRFSKKKFKSKEQVRQWLREHRDDIERLKKSEETERFAEKGWICPFHNEDLGSASAFVHHMVFVHDWEEDDFKRFFFKIGKGAYIPHLGKLEQKEYTDPWSYIDDFIEPFLDEYKAKIPSVIEKNNVQTEEGKRYLEQLFSWMLEEVRQIVFSLDWTSPRIGNDVLRSMITFRDSVFYDVNKNASAIAESPAERASEEEKAIVNAAIDFWNEVVMGFKENLILPMIDIIEKMKGGHQ